MMTSNSATGTSYCDGLKAKDRDIYMSELLLPDGSKFPDPFTVRDGWQNDPKNWPRVTYFDIVNYFIHKVNLFSLEETKAYKSLEAYIYAVEGHVQEIKSFKLDNYTALKAQVLPSQRQGVKTKMYDAFILVNGDGQVHTAHCTCMAGNGKVCSHAAAIAFKVEFAVRAGLVDTVPTEELCKWNVAAKSQVKPALLAQMDFSKANKDEDQTSRERKTTLAPTHKKLTKVSVETAAGFFPEAVLTTVHQISHRSRTEMKSPTKKQQIPIVSEIISELRGEAGSEELFFSKMALTAPEIAAISVATKGQKKNEAWLLTRKGRLTASNFGLILTSKKATPSLIKRVAGDQNQDLSHIKSIAWGTTHEVDAINSFTTETGLSVNETGVWLDVSGTLGASPDGLVGDNSVLEVKCPFSFREKTIEECLEDKKFCLERGETGFSLKFGHSYWHQVQGQMYLTGRPFCFFVVWTKRDCCILKISKDDSWAPNLEILKMFYRLHVLPFLMS